MKRLSYYYKQIKISKKHLTFFVKVNPGSLFVFLGILFGVFERANLTPSIVVTKSCIEFVLADGI